MAKITKTNKAKHGVAGGGMLKSKPKTKIKTKAAVKPKSKVKTLKVNIIEPAKKAAEPINIQAEKAPASQKLFPVSVKENVVSAKPASARGSEAKISFTPPFMPLSAQREVVKKAIDDRGEVEKAAEAKPFIAAPTAKKETSAAPRPVGLYRKIAFSFIFLTLALLAVIFYFSFVKVTITLITNKERVSSDLVVDIYDKDKGSAKESAVAGVVTVKEIEETKIYRASGGEIIGEEAVGKVTIVNNYSKNQPLVATTRLLSVDNKLFRIKDTVNVPAGGSVEADIYADAPSPEMAIGLTRFTIPGLWAGLQNQIYAESKEAIKYQKKVKSVISQSDIDAAVADLKQALLARAKSEIDSSYADYDERLYNIDENAVSAAIDGKVGEEKEEFKVTMKTAVVLVAFKSEDVFKTAEEKLALVVPDDKELVEFDKNGINYSLVSFDPEQGVATVNAAVEGKMVLSADSGVVDKSILVGLSKQQLNDYLSGLPEIAGFDIKFSPSFINKVPNLVDRIEIEIKK